MACRVSKHGAAKVTPFQLVYRQEEALPLEINLQSGRVMYQDSLSAEDYRNQLIDRLDDLPEIRFEALRELEKEKLRVAKTYNKRVIKKLFQVGDLVWKMILPVGSRDNKFGKWSLSWEGPYKVTRIVPGNAYFVENLER
jgi:hypothetical protein